LDYSTRIEEKSKKETKGTWVEQLPHVLWAYQTTLHFAIGETPFRMAYGTTTVILLEIGESTFKIINLNLNHNEGNLITELDLIEEKREVVVIRDATLERKIAAKNNKNVIPLNLVQR